MLAGPPLVATRRRGNLDEAQRPGRPSAVLARPHPAEKLLAVRPFAQSRILSPLGTHSSAPFQQVHACVCNLSHAANSLVSPCR